MRLHGVIRQAFAGYFSIMSEGEIARLVLQENTGSDKEKERHWIRGISRDNLCVEAGTYQAISLDFADIFA